MRNTHCCIAILSRFIPANGTYIEIVRQRTIWGPDRRVRFATKMEIEIMSANSLSAPNASSNVQDQFLVGQVDLAMDARRLRAQAFADFTADALVAAGTAFKAAIARLKSWNERRVTHAELESLDDRILADIGLSRSEIGQVAAGHYVREASDYRQNATDSVREAANQDRNRDAA